VFAWSRKEKSTMSKHLKLAIGLATILTISLIVLGTAAPGASKAPAKSPYVSALSDIAVGTAVAASHGCNHRTCEVLQALYFCRSEGARDDCKIVNGRCTGSGCP